MSFFNDCFFGGFFRAVQIVGGPQCDEQWHQTRHCEQYTDCGSKDTKTSHEIWPHELDANR
jgi:hypothetical protein